MLFKILVYNGCILAQFFSSMLGCQYKGHEFKACHIYRSNILFLHLICAILTRQWFVKKPFHLNRVPKQNDNDKLKNIVALTDYNDKLKNQTLQPQTASDKHEVLVLVLFNTSISRCLKLLNLINCIL